MIPAARFELAKPKQQILNLSPLTAREYWFSFLPHESRYFNFFKSEATLTKSQKYLYVTPDYTVRLLRNMRSSILMAKYTSVFSKQLKQKVNLLPINCKNTFTISTTKKKVFFVRFCVFSQFLVYNKEYICLMKNIRWHWSCCRRVIN